MSTPKYFIIRSDKLRKANLTTNISSQKCFKIVVTYTVLGIFSSSKEEGTISSQRSLYTASGLSPSVVGQFSVSLPPCRVHLPRFSYFQGVALLFLSLSPPNYRWVDLPPSKWQRDSSIQNHHNRPCFSSSWPWCWWSCLVLHITYFSLIFNASVSPEQSPCYCVRLPGPRVLFPCLWLTTPNLGNLVKVPHKERDIMRG